MKKLLLVVAVNEELKMVKGLLQDKTILREEMPPLWGGTLEGFPVEVLLTSVGPGQALAATQTQMSAEYGGVLIAGFCGGMSLTLRPGDAVIASKVLTTRGDGVAAIDSELCEKLGRTLISEGIQYRTVPLITSDRVLENPADKKDLLDKTGAEAVDMESFEIVNTAKQKDLRAAVVKVVVDDVETELPPFNEYIKTHGFLDHLGIKEVLTNHPQLSLRLRQLMKQSRQVLETIVPQIVPVVCQYWKIDRVL